MPSPLLKRGKVRYCAIALASLAFTIAALAQRSAGPAGPSGSQAGTPPSLDGTVSELVLVLIGAQSCGAHRNPSFLRAYQNIRGELRSRAAKEHRSLRTIGVALDGDPAAGIAFLQGFGPFDEVTTGGGWSNEGALRFLWTTHPGRPSIPQLVVLQRELQTLPAVRVTREVVRRRLIGVREISSGSVFGDAGHLPTSPKDSAQWRNYETE